MSRRLPLRYTRAMHQLARALLDGEQVDDDAFDALLSLRSQVCSRSFWSPVSAARRAAALFREQGAQRVLDVGAGAGKFCVVASLVLGRRVWGVERRESLVLEGRAVAAQLGADVELLHGTLVDVDPPRVAHIAVERAREVRVVPVFFVGDVLAEGVEEVEAVEARRVEVRVQ